MFCLSFAEFVIRSVLYGFADRSITMQSVTFGKSRQLGEKVRDFFASLED